MRAKQMWPGSGSRRVEGYMAARPDPSPAPNGKRSDELSPAAIAVALTDRRDRLIRQLPRQIKLARRLTDEQLEWVVDESTHYLVVENKDRVIKNAYAL